jgi:membrane protein YqaA with SNARE-associated domain
MIDLFPYGGLFLSALLAATLFPVQSEVVLVGMLVSDYDPVTLVMVATVGNVLGAVINWAIGLQIHRFRDHKWMPVSPAALERASARYRRYGRWSLLLSWMPFIGDPLTVVAGVLREPAWTFLILVTLAKAGRYIFLTMATLGLA